MEIFGIQIWNFRLKINFKYFLFIYGAIIMLTCVIISGSSVNMMKEFRLL